MSAENASPAPVSTSTCAAIVDLERLEHLDHFAIERRAHGVALFRTVEKDPGDPVLELDLDVGAAGRGLGFAGAFLNGRRRAFLGSLCLSHHRAE